MKEKEKQEEKKGEGKVKNEKEKNNNTGIEPVTFCSAAHVTTIEPPLQWSYTYYIIYISRISIFAT